MRRIQLCCAALLAATAAAAWSQQREVKWNNPDAPLGKGLEHRSFKSASMETEVGYCVYLPPGYAAGSSRYPVVYFLHGAGGNENSDAGGFSSLLARLAAEGKAPPVICVFPNGGMSGYRDRPAEKIMGETLLVRELVPLIDKTFRTRATRDGRVLAGFSMGGGGAVRLALKHPDVFSAAGSWAGALAPRRGGADSELLGETLTRDAGKVRLLLIVGDKDFTFAGHAPVVKSLRDAGSPLEYRVLPGVEHNLGVYYEKTGEELGRFLTAGFKSEK